MGGKSPQILRSYIVLENIGQNHRSFTNYIVTIDIKEIPLDFQPLPTSVPDLQELVLSPKPGHPVHQ